MQSRLAGDSSTHPTSPLLANPQLLPPRKATRYSALVFLIPLLTLCLQETDKLEDEKSGLQREIEELQKQKERLELVLEAHRPICKIPEGAKESNTGGTAGTSGTSGTNSPPASSRPVPCISLSPGPVLEPEALHTPTLMTTPSLTPFTSNLVFTYPSTSEQCASAHRRSSSSSGDPSSDPLGSPTLLAL